MELPLSVMHMRTHTMAQWQDGVRENFLPLEFSGRRDHGFAASLMGRRLGDAHVACVSSPAHRVIRTPLLAEQSQERCIKLFWQISGSSLVEQAGRTSTLAPGSWTFYDTSRPYAIEGSASDRFAVMLLPQSYWLGAEAAAGHLGTAFAPSGTSRVALMSVMTVLRDPQHYEGPTARAVVESIAALMRAALQAQASREARPLLHARLAQVQRYIAEHIDDPDLTPERIAAAMHISRRTLYTWFAQMCQSPSAFIQQTRLEQCRLALGDPGRRHLTITRIAFDHGFNDMAHFSRLFKHAFHASPRDYRKRVLE